jgi:tRNA A-37 threonylcarbamoyl transferase component Bud32
MLVDGRYQIIEQLGAGGMCNVYRAQHVQLNREVAVKVLQDKLLTSDAALRRFQREAVAVSSLEHPNIVCTLGSGIWDGRPFLVMELLSGQSLQETIKNSGPMIWERALPIFRRICDGLEYAHSQGIVHRDLKPSNVMVTADGGVKIVDFGIAKILPESGKEIQKLTQTGDLFGTLPYMSPEQLLGKNVDGRSDLYSFGCLIYEVLEGKPPFTGETPFEVVNKHLKERAETPKACTAEVASIIMRLLAKQPGDRLQSAAELRSAFDNPGSVQAPQYRAPSAKLPSRPVMIAVASAAVLVMGVLLSLPKPASEVDSALLAERPIILRHMQAGEWKEARALAEAKLSRLDARVQTGEYLDFLNLLADCDMTLKNWDVALYEYRQLNSFAVAMKKPHTEMAAAGGIAVCLMHQHDLVAAAKYAAQESVLANSYGSPEQKMAASLHVALCELSLGKTLSERSRTAKGYKAMRDAFDVLERNPEITGTTAAKHLREQAVTWHYKENVRDGL